MITKECNSVTATIKLTADELLMIHEALNEVCHGIYIQDFIEKIGWPKERVKLLLSPIRYMIDEINKKIIEEEESW